MANSPVDTVPSIMMEEFGTKCLITSPKADYYLSKSEKLGKTRHEKWCGGKDGWDNYCERYSD